MSKNSRFTLLALTALLATGTPQFAGAADAAADTEELRDTVINLLDALVAKGVITAEQAKSMVANAQAKAAAAANVQRINAEEEKNSVRVTAVPQIVQDQITKAVSDKVTTQVAETVVQQAKREGWGIPGALPGWVANLNFYGDVRMRAEDDSFDKGNAAYLDYNTINSKGGIGKAGDAAFLNTDVNRFRLVGRARLGLTAKLGDSLSLDARLASGSASNPISTNQTLGNYDNPYTVNLDRAALRYRPFSPTKAYSMDLRLGRFDNPFVTNSELIFDQDLNFEGVAATFNRNYLDRFDRVQNARKFFLTVGAFPIQEVELSSADKWLLGGQLGTELRIGTGSRFRFAAGFYDYRNISGVRNTVLGSTQMDYTAPKFLTKGNTLYDIRFDNDPTTNLLALAGKYELATGLVQLDALAWNGTHLVLSGEYVKNVGWKISDVVNRVGSLSGLYYTGSSSEATSQAAFRARTTGYDAGFTLGSAQVRSWGDWRIGVSYRYVERDAVLDAFTDSDFHLGGTDARGYVFSADLGLARSAFARLRYLSANSIDGAPLGIDVAQLDLVGQF